MLSWRGMGGGTSDGAEGRTVAIRRRLTAALALAYVLGVLAHALHFAQVRHEVCEHGDVVHAAVEDADGIAPAPSSLEPEGESLGGPVLEGAPATDGDHHHCPLATSAPCERVALARGGGGPELEIARTAEPRREAPRGAPFELYLLAPHHSPPAA